MNSYVALALALTAVITVGLGAITYLFSRDKQIPGSFFILTLLIAVWISSTYGVQVTASDGLLFWVRASHAMVVPALVQLQLFLTLFSSSPTRTESGVTNMLHFGLGAAALILGFSPLVVSTATFTPDHYAVQYGWGMYLFVAYVVWWATSVVQQLRSRLRGAHAAQREQLRLFLIGTIGSSAYGIAADLILPLLGYRGLVDTSPVATLLVCGITAYAITNQRVFDLRLAIKRIIVLTSVIIFISGVYGLTLWGTGLSTILRGERTQLFIDLTIAALVAFSTQPLRRWVSGLVDSLLFKQSYDEQEVVRNLVVKLNGVIGLDEAIELVMNSIMRTLHLEHVATYVFPQPGHENEQPIRIRHIGYEKTSELPLAQSDGVYEYFTKHDAIVSLEELQTSHLKNKIRPLIEKLERIEAAVVIPLHIKKGELIGLICLSKKLSDFQYTKRDIALLNTIGEQAISSIQKARLYESDQAKNEFVSVASHELITPISAMEGYLSYVMKPQGHEKKLKPQTIEYLENVRSSVHRLSAQLKDLLDVSRIESGKMNMDFKEHDMIKLIQDTISQLRFVAEDKGITLNFVAPRESVPHIWADGDRTIQVLVNLISNAIKYNREKGSVIIEAEVRRAEGLVQVSVSDTGFGMKSEQMTHLFEKFYRVDSAKTVGIIGTGLGLYITKSIVERMGGTITVESVEEKGTTFTFTVPAAGRANPILN